MFRPQGPPKPNQQCAPTKFSILLASLILRETCGTIRCTEQHFYTMMMLSHNRFLRLMAMHSILYIIKKHGVHLLSICIPLVSQVVKMYLKDLYTQVPIFNPAQRLETCLICARFSLILHGLSYMHSLFRTEARVC